MSNLAQKDLFACLGIWLVLEIISFGVLPAIGLTQPNLHLENWLIASLPLGIGGAFLFASSTRIVTSPVHVNHPRRVRRDRFALISSWVGLLGIGFPILVISLQIFAKLFSIIKG